MEKSNELIKDHNLSELHSIIRQLMLGVLLDVNSLYDRGACVIPVRLVLRDNEGKDSIFLESAYSSIGIND